MFASWEDGSFPKKVKLLLFIRNQINANQILRLLNSLHPSRPDVPEFCLKGPDSKYSGFSDHWSLAQLYS